MFGWKYLARNLAGRHAKRSLYANGLRQALAIVEQPKSTTEDLFLCACPRPNLQDFLDLERNQLLNPTNRSKLVHKLCEVFLHVRTAICKAARKGQSAQQSHHQRIRIFSGSTCARATQARVAPYVISDQQDSNTFLVLLSPLYLDDMVS